jgi:hypothetical protein
MTGFGKVNTRISGVGFVLAVYAASRIFYLILGWVLARVVPISGFQRITSDVPSGSMNIWSHWDGEHYVALAMDGYLQGPKNVPPAFFPLYPLIVRSCRGRINRRVARVASVSDNLRLLAYRTGGAFRDARESADGCPTVRAHGIPDFYRARALIQEQTALRRMVDPEHNRLSSLVRALCELALCRVTSLQSPDFVPRQGARRGPGY